MSFKDFKKHLLDQDDRHQSNRKIPVGNGKIETAPNFDSDVAVDVSKYDMPGDKHTPNGVFNPKPGEECKPAQNYDHETAFGDDGM